MKYFFILLLIIKTPVTYTDYIVPACIPSESASYAGLIGIATGWGTTESNGAITRYLMEVPMPWLTDARCKQKYPAIADITNSICAGETGDNTDTCQVNKFLKMSPHYSIRFHSFPFITVL